mmetsp:Transcript_1729/g.10671  ORF Transcript_1729/g.10671 Transcript_1729/m.10671 type:complete len:86 (+) Transcript_1729:175-432(+)
MHVPNAPKPTAAHVENKIGRPRKASQQDQILQYSDVLHTLHDSPFHMNLQCVPSGPDFLHATNRATTKPTTLPTKVANVTSPLKQ